MPGGSQKGKGREHFTKWGQKDEGVVTLMLLANATEFVGQAKVRNCGDMAMGVSEEVSQVCSMA